MALGVQQPGESALQYALRMGVSPNDASAYTADLAQSNPSGAVSYQNSLGGYVNRRATAPTAAQSSAWGNSFQGAGYGGGTGNTSPAGIAPVSFGQPLANRGGSSTAAGALATAGNLTTPRAGGNYPPINPGEDSAAYMRRIGMDPTTAQLALTMSQQNPGMSFQDIMAKVGGGGAGGLGLSPINANEDPMAYMTRIGMSPAQAQAALTMSQQNPGMSFQDIIARINAGGAGGGGAGGGSTGNNVNPATQGVPLSTVTGTGTGGGVNGVPGYGGTFNLANWQDPGYDFRLQQGNQLLQGSAAAQGNLLSGPTLKAITDYGQNSASQEYQNAYNRFTGNRDFNYGVDVGDRNFDYLTQTGDRNFNYQMLKDLAAQGQYGTTGAADVNRVLATLLSGNTIAGGNANAANTIGGSNAITNAISQMIAGWLGQNTLNRIPGLNPG